MEPYKEELGALQTLEEPFLRRSQRFFYRQGKGTD
jgi:hypothetical protein